MKTPKVQEGFLQQGNPSSPPAAATETIHFPDPKLAKVDVEVPAGFSFQKLPLFTFPRVWCPTAQSEVAPCAPKGTSTL